MSIQKKAVEHIAQLSRLMLTEEELVRMEAELDAILKDMKTLEQASISTEPLADSGELCNVMREDEVHPSWDRSVLLENAAVRCADSMVVPKTVE